MTEAFKKRIWINVFWFIRNAGAAFRLGWDEAGSKITQVRPGIGGVKL